jgi:hypothetical protein
MATLINADTSDGLKLTSDTSGLIEFQSGGVTKAGVNATGLTGDGSQLTAIPAPAALTTASGSAPSYSARAWVNFNGTGAVAIRDSGNVSSITDQGGTGLYAVNFTTAMPDINYCVAGMKNAAGEIRTGVNSTGSVEIRTTNSSGTLIDMSEIMVAIFR